MSNLTPLSIVTILPTNGSPGTDLNASATSSSSISLTSSSFSTDAGSTSSGTTSLPPSTSNISSTLISTSSSLTSISVTSITSSTEIPSTSSPPLISTSTSTETSSTTTITTVDTDNTSTSTALVPTTFVNPQSDSNDLVSHRTAVIAGTTIGLIAFILIILTAIFIYRRHKLRKVMEVSGKKREGRGLLDGEEFDDDERNNTSMQSYQRPYPTNSSLANSSALSLLKPRTTEIGSIFREEVWPPPGFIDPISKQSSQVDLSRIVDDIMGPSTSYEPSHSSSNLTTSSRGSSVELDERRQPTDASTMSTLSSTSTAPLITKKPYSDPFQPNLGPSIRTPSLPASSSVPATMPRAFSKLPYPTVASTRSIPSLPPPTRAQPRLLNTQPQKSSPLARSLTGETNLWLTRNVRPNRTTAPAPP